MPCSILTDYFDNIAKLLTLSRLIAIGLASHICSLLTFPGWDEDSWGYHGDDGNKYGRGLEGEDYGETFTTHDTIGCLWNVQRGDIYFTKNNVSQGRET